MSRERVRSAWGTAAALSALTLTVFFLAKDSGPFYPVKELHELAQRKPEALEFLFTPGSRPGEIEAILRDVRRVTAQADQVRLAQVAAAEGGSIVTMSYWTRTGSVWHIQFFCVPTRNGWRIDARSTIERAMSRLPALLGG
jgi:hypothetical protein